MMDNGIVISDNDTPTSVSIINELENKCNLLTKMVLELDGTKLQYIENPSDEYIMIAVKQNGMAIQYVPADRQTWVIKAAAIESDPHSLKYIHKPKYELYRMAVITPYDGKDHPIHLLRDSGYVHPYIVFIDNNPAHFEDIIPDIEGLSVEHLIWKYVIINYKDYDYSWRCPLDIQKKIINDVMRCDPECLTRFDESLWTKEWIISYIKANPEGVKYIYGYGKTDDIMSTGELYKIALDNCADNNDAYWIINSYPEDTTFDDLVLLLESKCRFYVIRNGELFSLFNNISSRDISEYIIHRFTLEDLVDNVPFFRLEYVFDRLSLFKRIKYKRKLKKQMKKMLKNFDKEEN